MGVSYSNSLKHLESEVETKFLRPLESSVQTQKLLSDRPFEERARKVLFTYPSLLMIGFMDGMEIDLGHLAVLFVLDADKDGLFSWRDIKAFVEWVHGVLPVEEKDQGSEFSEAVHARCVLEMWRICTGIRGSTNAASGGKEKQLATEVDVTSVISSPAHDALNPNGRSNSVTSLGTNVTRTHTNQQHHSGSVASDGSSRVGDAEQEIFEKWFELFLTRNFPFADDRLRQQAPVGVADRTENTPGSAAATGHRGSTQRSSTSTAHQSQLAFTASAAFNSLIVDVAGSDAISVSEITRTELRLHPKALSLDAIAAAHALLGVEPNGSLSLKEFCILLVGEENIRRQGKHFSCPSHALRAFSTAFIDEYFAALYKFDLQALV